MRDKTVTATILCLFTLAAIAAAPLPETPEFARLNWGASLQTVEKLLNRKLIRYGAPGQYDGGNLALYGLSASLTLEVGAVDGLRGATFVVDTDSAAESQEQLNRLHGRLEAALGRPVLDDQTTSASGEAVTTGTEWRWSDGSVLLLPQPGNKILIAYEQTSPSHETLMVTKRDLDAILPGTAKPFPWPLNGGVLIVRRTQGMIQALHDHAGLADPDSSAPPSTFLKLQIQGSTPLATRTFVHTDERSINPEYGVFRNVAPLEGCVILFKDGSSATRSEIQVIAQLGDRWHGGFYDVCRKVAFDSAGRAYENSVNMPNLMVPEYRFRSDGSLMIGAELSK